MALAGDFLMFWPLSSDPGPSQWPQPVSLQDVSLPGLGGRMTQQRSQGTGDNASLRVGPTVGMVTPGCQSQALAQCQPRVHCCPCGGWAAQRPRPRSHGSA